MSRFKHNFKDGDIVIDVDFNEVFVFSDSRDGFKAEFKPETFRLATEDEKRNVKKF